MINEDIKNKVKEAYKLTDKEIDNLFKRYDDWIKEGIKISGSKDNLNNFLLNHHKLKSIFCWDEVHIYQSILQYETKNLPPKENIKTVWEYMNKNNITCDDVIANVSDRNSAIEYGWKLAHQNKKITRNK